MLKDIRKRQEHIRIYSDFVEKDCYLKDTEYLISLIDKYKQGFEEIIEHCYSCAGDHAPPEKEIIRIAKSCLERSR